MIKHRRYGALRNNIKNKMKKLYLLCVLFGLLLLSGCSTLQNYRPVEDINDMEGRRVGVGLSGAPDYLLTSRDDMTLMRYDSTASLIMSLCYRKVDVIALELPYANQVLMSVSGISKVEPAVDEIGIVAYVANDRKDVLEEFNSFITEFCETEEYVDLVTRMNAEGEFLPREVPVEEGTRTLKVGIATDSYPFCYVDFKTGEFLGSDVEFIRHFANAYDYNIEFYDGDYNSMELGVVYQKTDVGISGIAELWRDDVELGQKAMVSNVYMTTQVVYLEVEDPDELEIKVTIED